MKLMKLDSVKKRSSMEEIEDKGVGSTGSLVYMMGMPFMFTLVKDAEGNTSSEVLTSDTIKFAHTNIKGKVTIMTEDKIYDFSRVTES